MTAERTVANASLGVYAHEYLWEGATVRGSRVDELAISSTRAPGFALFHPTSALYGFTGLAPGKHRLRLVDPRGYYLPRVLEVDAPDRRVVERALLLGVENPPRGPIPPLYSAPMRPGPDFPFRHGDTLVRGYVRTAAGKPVAFARVEVDDKTGSVQVATYTDLSGRYVASLRQERVTFVLPPEDVDPDDDIPPEEATLQTEFPRNVRCFPPKFAMPKNLAAGDETRALEAFPATFDAMTADAAARSAAYAAPVAAALTITVGQRTEQNFTLP